jgi:aspartate 1-decarboxylase
MQVHLLKSKLHRAFVTEANLEYEGSLTIAADLMAQVGLLPYERILCGNLANGARFETYAIPGRAGSGDIILNGAVARLGKTGDRLTIMSYAAVDAAKARAWKPRVAVLGPGNRILDQRGI